MPYVTCGTVQVAINTSGIAKIRIAPRPDYSPRHGDKRYIILA